MARAVPRRAGQNGKLHDAAAAVAAAATPAWRSWRGVAIMAAAVRLHLPAPLSSGRSEVAIMAAAVRLHLPAPLSGGRSERRPTPWQQQ